MKPTLQQYEEALERVEEVMGTLEQRHTDALEREMIELNLLIDAYETDIEGAA